MAHHLSRKLWWSSISVWESEMAPCVTSWRDSAVNGPWLNLSHGQTQHGLQIRHSVKWTLLKWRFCFEWNLVNLHNWLIQTFMDDWSADRTLTLMVERGRMGICAIYRSGYHDSMFHFRALSMFNVVQISPSFQWIDECFGGCNSKSK